MASLMSLGKAGHRKHSQKEEIRDNPGLVQCFSLKNKPEPVPPTAA